MLKTPAIGIDLGTTNCRVAVVEDGHAIVIFNDMGLNITPSYVSFTNTDVLIGDLAKIHYHDNLKNTVFDVKRMIGRTFDDSLIQLDIEHWPFDVISEDYKIHIKVEHAGEIKKMIPEEISGLLISYLKKIAEDYLREDVEDAVISVPAYFNNSQRLATKHAGEIAGFNVLKIVNEPTAAAVAYGLQKSVKQRVLIYDLGGGTFDVSIIDVDGLKTTVKAVVGNDHLGGKDFNKALVEHCIEHFKKKHGINLEQNKKAIVRLYHQCENAKILLSKIIQTPIHVDCISDGIDFNLDLTRTEFDNLNMKLFTTTVSLVSDCLKVAKLNKEDIEHIILLGGSSRIVVIEDMLKNSFVNASVEKCVNEAVAIGAAIIANNLTIQKVFDVTPLSLGIGVIGGLMDVVILKNTPIPAKATRTYSTIISNQTDMEFDVYEGEERLVKDNRLLGTFFLTGITASVEKRRCQVTFDIDFNGILSIHAKEEDSQNENKIRITRSGIWSEDNIKGIVKEREHKHDTNKRKCIIFQNELEK